MTKSVKLETIEDIQAEMARIANSDDEGAKVADGSSEAYQGYFIGLGLLAIAKAKLETGS